MTQEPQKQQQQPRTSTTTYCSVFLRAGLCLCVSIWSEWFGTSLAQKTRSVSPLCISCVGRSVGGTFERTDSSPVFASLHCKCSSYRQLKQQPKSACFLELKSRPENYIAIETWTRCDTNKKTCWYVGGQKVHSLLLLHPCVNVRKGFADHRLVCLMVQSTAYRPKSDDSNYPGIL